MDYAAAESQAQAGKEVAEGRGASGEGVAEVVADEGPWKGVRLEPVWFCAVALRPVRLPFGRSPA
eukprot:4346436-Lingulodinium_polyedra.AAC.1